MSVTLDLSLRLVNAEAQVSRRFAGELAAIHGLGMSDFVIMLNLRHAPGGRMRRIDLAGRLGMSQSGVTRALMPLERIGLVRRETDPRDARVGYAAITAAGRRRVEEATATAERISDELFGTGWSPRDVEQLTRLLDQLGAVGLQRPGGAA